MSDDKTQGTQQPSDENVDEFKPRSEDEIRQEVINDYEFDEELDSEKIDKLVKKELSNQEKLSTAIKQKIKQREEKEALAKKLEEKPEPEKKSDTSQYVTREELEKDRFDRQMEELGLGEDLTKEVEKVAKLNKVSPKKALEDPYIKFLLEQQESLDRVENATLGNKPQSVSRRSAPDKIDTTKYDRSKEGIAKMEADLKKRNEVLSKEIGTE